MASSDSNTVLGRVQACHHRGMRGNRRGRMADGILEDERMLRQLVQIRSFCPVVPVQAQAIRTRRVQRNQDRSRAPIIFLEQTAGANHHDQ